jgi:hypothetical protein
MTFEQCHAAYVEIYRLYKDTFGCVSRNVDMIYWAFNQNIITKQERNDLISEIT